MESQRTVGENSKRPLPLTSAIGYSAIFKSHAPSPRVSIPTYDRDARSLPLVCGFRLTANGLAPLFVATGNFECERVLDVDVDKPRRASRGARQKLIAAAKEILIREGNNTISVSEVARLAEVNRATAYKYFASREDLIRAAVGEIAATMRDFVKTSSAINGSDFVATSRALQLFIMNNRESCRAWAIEALLSGKGREDPLSQQIQGLELSLIGGEYMTPDIDSEVLAVISLAATFIWPLWNDTDNCDAETRLALAERFTREFIRFSLFGAMKPERFSSLVSYLKEPEAARSSPAKPEVRRRKGA